MMWCFYYNFSRFLLSKGNINQKKGSKINYNQWQQSPPVHLTCAGLTTHQTSEVQGKRRVTVSVIPKTRKSGKEWKTKFPHTESNPK